MKTFLSFCESKNFDASFDRLARIASEKNIDPRDIIREVFNRMKNEAKNDSELADIVLMEYQFEEGWGQDLAKKVGRGLGHIANVPGRVAGAIGNVAKAGAAGYREVRPKQAQTGTTPSAGPGWAGTPAPQGQAPQGQAPQGQAPQGQAPQGQAPQGQAPQGQAPQGQAPQGQAPQGQAPQDDGSWNNATPDRLSQGFEQFKKFASVQNHPKSKEIIKHVDDIISLLNSGSPLAGQTQTNAGGVLNKTVNQ